MGISSNFKWIGKGTVVVKRKQNILQYESFEHGKLCVSVDDFVLVRNMDSTDPEDNETCFVGQVKSLFDNGCGDEPFQASVQWYYRIFELSEKQVRLIPDFNPQFEVVEVTGKLYNHMIDAESIFGKCLVSFFPVDIDPRINMEKSRTSFISFYCRYKFSGTKFVPKISPSEAKSSKKLLSNGKTVGNGYRTKSAVIQELAKEQMCCEPSVHESPKNGLVLKPLVISIKKIDDEICYSLNKRNEDKISKGEELSCFGKVNSVESSPMQTPKSRLQRSKSRTPKTAPPYTRLNGNLPQSVQTNDACVGQKSAFLKSPIIHTVSHKEIVSESSDFCLSIPKILLSATDTISDEKKADKPRKTPVKRQLSVESSTSLKREKTRRTLDFGSDASSPSVTTRYGRKVKSCYNLAVSDLDSLLSTPKKNGTPRRREFCNVDESDSDVSKFEPTDDESSDEFEEDFTPISSKAQSARKGRATPRRTTTPQVRRSSKKRSNGSTPTIPHRQQPLKTPVSLIEESRQRLHVSAIPDSLPCRDEEYSDIYSFIESNLLNRTGGCMYISGVPGTGKTATVHEVIRNLERHRDKDDLPFFKFIEVNGMKMTDPYQCYVQIFKSLTGERVAPQQAANMLEKSFLKPGPKKEAIILLVDELDKLWTRKQTVMYNLFDWPTKPSSKLIVLAIANTMDLPERMMMSRVSSRLGLTRKTFQPYTFRELQEIIMSRIQELDVFDPDAVQLVARKVAAVSGDARRALEICRRAVEVAEEGSVVVTPSKKKKKVLVGMGHVDAALNQMLSSPEVAAIRGCSELQKLFFRALLAEFQRTGSEETNLFRVYNQFVSLCRFEGFHPPTTSDASSVCAHLASSYLILIDNMYNDLYMKIRLNVSIDDINYALTGLIN